MKKIIGIVGPSGCGKDTVANYISQKLQMPCVQTGDVIREMAIKNSLPTDRATLIKIGIDLVEQNGKDYLIAETLKKIPEKGIIGGIRQIAQVEYLRNNSDLILLSVIANDEVRLERIKKRGKLGDAQSQADLIENDRKENTYPNAIRECMKLADYTIENNQGMEQLYKHIDTFLTHIH